MADSTYTSAMIDALRRKYMESVGNPARQLIGGGVRGYLGLEVPEYADELGREAYANAQALGNTPGIGAPAGAFKAMAAAPLLVKALRKAPRDEALEVARKNAVKMLGLPENNTPMDRAKALGFDTEAFHATQADVQKFKTNKVTPYGDRFFFSPDSNYANQYADLDAAIAGNSERVKAWKAMNAKDAGPNMMPVLLRQGGFKDWTHISPEYVVKDPANIRSRFAAFDPAKANKNDLLGRASPEFLGLLAAGSATGATVAALRNKKEDEKRKKDKDSAK